MNKYSEIEITKDDLKKIVYFILMKFRADPLHRQGTSAKRDLIGGYIERWFNKIAETVVFDNLLESKSYNAVSDNFIYTNDSDKNAPDILGLQIGEKTIPFALFKNGAWESVADMPRIEIKVARKDQALLGVREPQMIDDYYAFIESNLEGDYLTSLFEDSVFEDAILNRLKMSDDFIDEDNDSQIIQHEKIIKASKIGTFRLIGIYTKDELRKHSVMCRRGVNPYYFGGAENKDPRGSNCDEELVVDELGRFIYKYDDSYVALPISIEKPDGISITIKKKNKGSVYINSTHDLLINGIAVNAGNIVIYFTKFERSSNWDENIVSKYILEKYGHDSTSDLLSCFDEIIANDNE